MNMRQLKQCRSQRNQETIDGLRSCLESDACGDYATLSSFPMGAMLFGASL
jgi:hypothetical protein